MPCPLHSAVGPLHGWHTESHTQSRRTEPSPGRFQWISGFVPFKSFEHKLFEQDNMTSEHVGTEFLGARAEGRYSHKLGAGHAPSFRILLEDFPFLSFTRNLMSPFTVSR